MTETPFGLVCEKRGALDGSVNAFAKADFEIFRKLFHYDFSEVEQELEIDCFSVITNYRSIAKAEKYYNKSVSDKVKELSKNIASASDKEEVFQVVTGFYKDYGVGLFGLNKAFRLQEQGGGQMLVPITNTEEVKLDDLIGYEIQKAKLVENTKAFVEGRKANNVLLYGDAGTGKSTSIKAILNEYYKDGLRMIEIYKHQFSELAGLISKIKNRNYKFIIYMDDLSFEEFEIEYKYLKAVIEGGVETRPDNILIYATSNRRHLIKESWRDRNDVDTANDKHHSDTVEEKLSLVNRFGVTISFSKPSQKEFFEIVIELARREGITMSDEELRGEANKWELSHGGLSGRTAQQFINYLLGSK
jgi:predicted AAA+ superfamily ATPase